MLLVKPDPALQGLRGLAALGVVLSHLTGYFLLRTQASLALPLGFRAEELIYCGSRGVSLFFLLSGYLLVQTEGRRASEASNAYSLRAYAARRALRLVPAYYVAIGLAVLAWPTWPSLRDVLSQATFLYALDLRSYEQQEGGLTHLDHAMWSLTSEAAFYCLLPLIVLKLPCLWHRLALFGVLALVSLDARVYVQHSLAGLSGVHPTEYAFYGWVYFLPTTHLWLFGAGVLLGTHLEQPKPLLARGCLIAFGFAVSAFLILGLSLYDDRQALLMMLVDAMIGLLFLAVVLREPLLRNVLGGRIFGFLGDVSYPLYLVHGTILVLLFYRTPYLAAELRGGWSEPRCGAPTSSTPLACSRSPCSQPGPCICA